MRKAQGALGVGLEIAWRRQGTWGTHNHSGGGSPTSCMAVLSASSLYILEYMSRFPCKWHSTTGDAFDAGTVLHDMCASERW